MIPDDLDPSTGLPDVQRLRRADFGWRRLGRFLGLLVLVAGTVLFVAVAAPGVVGSDHSYVVRSDSMSPAIGAGSVVFVDEVPPDRLSVGDVITYQGSGAGTYRVTHRVTDVQVVDGDRRFRTKGDANEEPDPSPVQADAVVGVVRFHVPLIGYVVALANSQFGIVALVVVPGLLLAASELWNLYAGAPSRDPAESAENGGGQEP